MNNSINGMRVLVTGATGFVGSNLTRRLVVEGCDVHIIARPSSSLLMIGSIIDKVTIHYHDSETESMISIAEKAKPEITFHLASLFLAQHEPKDISPLVQSNILFGTQLIESLLRNGCRYFINTGTSWQHYDNQEYNPVCLYAATKQAFEALLTFYTETAGLQAITLKLFDTYGPADPRSKIINLLQKTAKASSVLAMSPGEQLLDLVYIDDVVEAFIITAKMLITDPNIQQADYSVSSGEKISLRRLVSIYEVISGTKLNINWGERPYRYREVMNPWAKGTPLPGWHPQINIEEGLKKLLEYNK